MQPTDDGTLLRQYVENHSDEAFAALVTQHINLVYSVALRHVGHRHLAEEVTQEVFIIFAKKAAQLRHDKALSSWLFQTTRFTADNFMRRETRRHRREQEAHMQSVLTESGSDVWPKIAPLLDEAVAGLSDRDRHAIVLRYYEGRNLSEVGAALGTSEDAAAKRISRAVERLREFFAKRGLTVGASGIVAVISANAVQAAPAGLALTISSSATLAGTTAAATAATKVIAMTTVQKTTIGVTLAAVMGAGIYEARQASNMRSQVQTLQRQNTSLMGQLQQGRFVGDEAAGKLASLQAENEQLKKSSAELLRLRGLVTQLQRSSMETANKEAVNDLIQTEANTQAAKAQRLKQLCEQMPDKMIPEMQYLSNNGQFWLNAAHDADLDTDAGISKALSGLRHNAKQFFAQMMGLALEKYARTSGGQLPADTSQLKPFFDMMIQVDDETLRRYQMTKTGSVSEVKPDDTVIVEKAPVDDRYDTLFRYRLGTFYWQGVGSNKEASGGGGLPWRQ